MLSIAGKPILFEEKKTIVIMMISWVLNFH